MNHESRAVKSNTVYIYIYIYNMILYDIYVNMQYMQYCNIDKYIYIKKNLTVFLIFCSLV